MVNNDQTRDTTASIEIELLQICNTFTDTKKLTREVISVLKRYAGCEAVGLRLHQGDDFPYFEVNGFANEFVEEERYLYSYNADGSLQVDSAGTPVLECICSNVIRGRFDPSKPFFTKHGSFWTNSTRKLLASSTEADRQDRTLNRCNEEGYESVALIPVVAHGKTLGVFQFNDHKAELFTLKRIEVLERLVNYAALAISDLEAVNTLHESEKQYRRFVETATEGIWGVDENNVTTYVNAQMAQLLGYSIREIIGQPMEAFLFEEDLPLYQILMAERKLGNADRYERRNRCKDGSTLWTLVSPQPIFNDEGKFLGSFGMFTDISARKRMEDVQNTRLHLIRFAEHHSLDELLQEGLDRIEELTASKIGFCHLLDEDQQTLSLQAWSSRTTSTFCNAEGKGLHYPVDQAGVWVDCLHEHRPVIHNDYASLPHRKGTPEGHPEVTRELVVPVFRGDKITAIFGVGNKPQDYNQQDVSIVTLFADMVWDIAERKITDIKLKESEDKYKSLLESSPNGVFVVQDGVYKYANHHGMQMLHCSAEQVNGLSAVDIVHPEDRADIIERIKRAESGTANEPMRVRINRPDGTILYSESSSVPIEYSGKPATLIVSRDVGSQIELERSLEETRQLQNVMLDNIKLGIVLVDTNGNFIRGNHEFFQMLGYQEEDLPDISVATITAPESMEQTGAAIQRLVSGQDPVLVMENVYLRKDGSRFYATTNATAVRDKEGKVLFRTAFIQDITEQKQAEKQIMESESRFRSFVESANDIVYSLSPDGKFTYLSPNWMDLLGYKPEETIGRSFEGYVHPEDRHQCWDFLQEILKTGQKNSGVEYRLKHKNGEWRWHTSNGSPLLDSSGRVIAFLGISRDTTERRQAAVALELEKNLLQQSQEMANLGSFVWDLRDDSLTWSRNMFVLHGLDPDSFEGNLNDVTSRLIHPDDLSRVQSEIQKMVAAHQVWAMQFRIVRTDSRIRIIQSSGEFEYDTCGNPVRCIGIHQDITERKEAEEALHENQEMLSLFISNSPIYTFIKDVTATESRVLQVSDNYDQMIGIPSREMAGKTMEELFPPEFAAKITADDWAVVTKGNVLQLEEELNNHSYTTIKFPIQQRDRTLLAGYTIDVTERKRAEDAVKKQERILEETQEIALIGSYELDFVNNSRYWSRETYRLLGLDETKPPPPALDGYLDMIHPDDAPTAYNALQTCLRTGKKIDITCRIITGSGELRYLHELGEPIYDNKGKVSRITGSIQDITDRKLAEVELKKHEQLLEESQRIARLGSFAIDLESKTRSWSSEIYRIFGMDENDSSPQMGGFEAMIHPDDARMEEDAFRDCIQNGRPIDLTYRIITIDGETRFVHELGRPEFGPEGKVIRFVGTLQDVTEGKKLENKLKESELRFRSIYENIPIGYQSLDPDGFLMDVNPAWSAILGYTREEVLGKWFGDFLVPEEDDLFKQRFPMFKKIGKVNGVEFHFVHKDGHVLIGNFNGMIEHDAFGEVVRTHCNLEDITTRKQIEESLHASLVEKDVLIREVHHRVKNNLAAILGLLDMERQTTSDSNAENLLLDLSNRIKSMSTVHEKLYRAENLSRIDFQDYLKSFVSHLKTTFRERENIATSIEANGIELNLDLAVPCGLIVNELVTNSLKYAFPEGKPGSRKENQCRIMIRMFREGTGYVLQVSDNGVGLPDEFNWQDTKSMGLRLVRMLGEHQLGGKIETDTTRGTTLTIRFEARLKEQDYV